MAHKCKCAICGEEFDRDIIQAVKHGARRYAHYNCYPEGELVPLKEKKKNKNADIFEYLIKLYGKDNVNYPLIATQIKKYVEQGYKESGILASLKWWYEIKGHNVATEDRNQNNGLGIIPYIYPQAKEYYRKISAAQEKNNNKDYTVKVKTIKVTIPKNEVKKNLFDSIEEGEIDG